ncbi:hypothetical protein AUJ66_06000 [Candidatus Desantisbacteria bacterium CG1_02_38_46]|uniref:Uncharacterized protein n=3 Tax=unclassified Candidatus Desantisiibacteriota TaxID=3106372 RepID=A0A2H9PBD3_9BACT|nr:MAG: hypothetical protein AUJ66_06000 [Candidatus Desantisbacteria bacterium CG1_02_38_46]PIU52261.1 MAG: hypothetical protein COS91_00120 [Candidatus Desantisbacteria bacterium CG07_land_8_20_14_0_80_39_15]PIZ15061.1 MAG: hypothetical protein COY51_06505 [Candidatus Desantisbacteria bacterium CG_4_10_14_0_8_um_filter_39_17]
MYCRKTLKRIKRTQDKERILLYWDVANKIWEYLEMSEKNGFFLNNYYKHFIRDLKISKETTKRLLRLRKTVKERTNLDVTKSWAYYTRRYYRLRAMKGE